MLNYDHQKTDEGHYIFSTLYDMSNYRKFTHRPTNFVLIKKTQPTHRMY